MGGGLSRWTEEMENELDRIDAQYKQVQLAEWIGQYKQVQLAEWIEHQGSIILHFLQ